MPSDKRPSVAICVRPANKQVATLIDTKPPPVLATSEVPTKSHSTTPQPESNVAVEPSVTRQPTTLIPRPLTTESGTLVKPTVPMQMSLTSRPITLPPRPQPGRKPLQDQHGTKRQEQNRSAQRNFRKRKAETLVQLKEDNEILRQEKQEIQVAAQGVQNDVERALIEARGTVESLEKQVKAHTEAREQAERDMAKLREEMAELKREVAQQRASQVQASAIAQQPLPTPREQNTPTTPVIYNKPSSMLTSLILPPIKARNCGSCEPKTCICFAESVQLPDADIMVPEPEVEQQDLAIDFTSWRPNPTPTVSQGPKRMAPGSCERCQVDPEQRAYCVSLSQQRYKPLATSSSSATHDSKRPRLTDLGATSSRHSTGLSIPCVEAYPLYKRFERVASSVTEDQLRAEVLRKQMRVGAASAFSNLSNTSTQQPSTLSENTIVRLIDGGISRDGVQFSAHEVDVSQVLASLRNAGPHSSHSGGSSGSHASDEVKTPGYEGEDLGSPATSVAEGQGVFEKSGMLGVSLRSPGVFEEGGFRF